MSVPVIDLFAGPGGLGEGFSKSSAADFRILLSIEKDEMAHETLRLRAAHRALQAEAVDDATWELWDRIVHDDPWNVVFYKLRDCGNAAIARACREADAEALGLELGPSSRQQVTEQLWSALRRYRPKGGLPANTVLIGGPPCQAYSIVGRSRNRGVTDYKPESDQRHFLYREYLHVIAELRPAVFVMENVKGILTSRILDRQIFASILRDLRRPGVETAGDGPEYILMALGVNDSLVAEPAPEDFLLRAEDFGVPQARHRVIILGVRRDVHELLPRQYSLRPSCPPTVKQVISDLPRLRPRLSHRGAGLDWRDAFEDPLFDRAIAQLGRKNRGSGAALALAMAARREEFRALRRDRGAGMDRVLRPVESTRQPKALQEWYVDRPSRLLANHESRAHMPSDLLRYLFVSSFGEVTGESPRLADFPPCLLPAHRNVNADAIDEAIFKDRFRVQLANRHSMTVTSHISKDGHAFIHPDPAQCRSLTVREAARIQTFPDSYVFLGNRTSQYVQVGNAVPPYLARQIADLVGEILTDAKLL
ncbi:MAG: DNA cytosine methyltransferase [Betaproteobacteria bacterium]|jgi:DNA (cytosine-5)-methyltransferase 1